ncbi:MAG TPA: hypothetical protein VK510_02640, partial [Solirubrobacteraceae bacterium]|nr:hypothetical protein [Solirubrobacteraceae bacterium]
DPPGTGSVCGRVRLENRATVSDWFAWARIGADAIAILAGVAGLRVAARWRDDGRWFAALEAP